MRGQAQIVIFDNVGSLRVVLEMRLMIQEYTYFLSNGIDGSLQMCSRHEGNNPGVYDSEVLRAVHA